MTSKTHSLHIIFVSLFLIALTACNAQSTHPISVSDGYARATFPMAKSAAVYLTLTNDSDTPITLTGVTVNPDVASDAQIHTTEMHNDMMHMREVDEGVKITADASVAFAPGSYHIMLLGLENGLSQGSEVSLTLQFDNQKALSVTLPVKHIAEESNHHQHH